MTASAEVNNILHEGKIKTEIALTHCDRMQRQAVGHASEHGPSIGGWTCKAFHTSHKNVHRAIVRTLCIWSIALT